MAKQYSLGLIETIGLTAAIVAADTAVKSANVTLVGYELSKGSGMTMVKVQGDVGAVTAAISAASAAVGKIGQVVSTRVIARPAAHLEMLIYSQDTVGIERPKATPCTPCAHIPTPVADAKLVQAPPEQISHEQTSHEQTSPEQISHEQTSPVEAPPEQAPPEQTPPEQAPPHSCESEAEADDEPHQPGQETESAGDAEKTDSQKKRKKKK